MSRKKFPPRPDAEKIFVSRSSPLPLSVPLDSLERFVGACLPFPWLSSSGGDDANRVLKLGKRTWYLSVNLGSIRGSWPMDLPHAARDRCFRDVEAEHLQLAMNARSAPGWVFSHHAEDEFGQFPAHASPACTSPMPGEPLPVQLESGPMPTDNRLRPHENQRTLPSIPEPPQHHPEQFVRDSKPNLWVPPFQNSELLPKSQIF
jgi:hypothetical protein